MGHALQRGVAFQCNEILFEAEFGERNPTEFWDLAGTLRLVYTREQKVVDGAVKDNENAD